MIGSYGATFTHGDDTRGEGRHRSNIDRAAASILQANVASNIGSTVDPSLGSKLGWLNSGHVGVNRFTPGRYTCGGGGAYPTYFGTSILMICCPLVTRSCTTSTRTNWRSRTRPTPRPSSVRRQGRARARKRPGTEPFPFGRPHRLGLGLPMVICVECLSADKPWDVVSATRQSSGVAPWACVRVYARVLVPPNLYIHTCMSLWPSLRVPPPPKCILLVPPVSALLAPVGGGGTARAQKAWH